MRRRAFLGCAVVLAGAVFSPGLLAAARPGRTRVLTLHNVNTGERLRRAYWSGGDYLIDGLVSINRLLRDHRKGEVYPIDPGLLDLLYVLQQELGSASPLQVVSGYRSPETNAMLRGRNRKVAKNSLHTRGKAIDIRLAGEELARLKDAAVAVEAGGVGYYPEDGFVHLDTGRVRYW